LKRVKHRYLLLQVDSDSSFAEREFLDALWDAITRLYGEHGASQTGLALVIFDEEKKTAVIRVALPTLQHVRAAITSITRIAGKEAAVHVTAISGTVKSLHEKAER
jgi:RNase P/RNase MRP subunit POP5